METAIVETVPDYLAEINQCETLEEFTTVGLSLRKQKDFSQWMLGVLARKVESKYGESSLAGFAKSIGVSASSLAVYRWVVKEFTSADAAFSPPERLPFATLQTVAKLPPEKRQDFLARAEDESMSVERVRQEVKKEHGEPVHAKFKTWFCEACVGWHFEPSNPAEWKPLHE